VYQRIYKELYPLYNDVAIFKIFERVYEEHFTVVEEKIKVRDTEELRSDSLQSPDDIDATYRNKRNKSYHGQAVNIVETCNPENPINLITDISVEANNEDDSEILNKRLDVMKEKTPDIEELHHDGGYGSEENDTKLNQHNITAVQTAIRGRDPSVEITIEQKEDKTYIVRCPSQTGEAEVVERQSDSKDKRYKAEFSETLCAGCSLSQQCKLSKGKNCRRYYFSEKEYLSNKRANNIYKIPSERRGLRANVEATVSEFKRKMHNGKLKVRGRFKTEVFAFSMGISINFGRIARFLKAQSNATAELCPIGDGIALETG
jgi:hypothetical protein